MSLIEMNLSDVIKKQYRFKWNSFIGAFGSLATIQLLGLLFSIGGVGGHGFSSGYVSIETTYYSANTIIVFTFLWAFITGILLTGRAARYDDFSFVTNRVSSNIANILFLLTASIIGGISAFFTKYLLKVIAYFFNHMEFIVENSAEPLLHEFWLGIVATILYVLLFSACGYFIGTLVQLHRIFVVLVPVMIIGLVIVSGITGNGAILMPTIMFIFAEPSIILFSLKVMLICAFLFLGSMAISNRMEVRK